MNAKQIIMRRAEIIADRVQAGWSLLDAHCPDWRASIDVYAVELDDASLCVVGQVYAEAWDTLNEGFVRRVQDWHASDQSTDRPGRDFPDNPYSYGLAQLIIASGAQVDTIEQRDDFARRHGFLPGMLSLRGNWGSATSEELNDAWSLALRGMEWGQP